MKAFFKTPIALLLAALAALILRKYRPMVVMVTGSVGKTSTKDALASVLADRFHLRASEKSYNSEFGVPLTIIGAKNPWENATAWLRVIREALALILLPNLYPKLLVLEVGADRPGDLARILAFCKPDMVVVTRLPDVPVHVEAYVSPQAVREEEFAPAYALSSGSPLVISADDPNAVTMAARLNARIITFGFADGADVQLEGYGYFEEQGIRGMKATMLVHGVSHSLRVIGAFGKSQLYAPAAAVAAGLALDMEVERALAATETYVPPAGRGRILDGMNGSLIIDDSYNASPAAVEEAIAALALLPVKGRRIAVVGDMLELGRYSAEQHERVGVMAAERVDMLVTVGARAKAACVAAVSSGHMDEECALSFTTAAEAAQALVGIVSEGDAILVKGSQGVRTERIVEALLAHEEDRVKLVRQEREWKRR